MMFHVVVGTEFMKLRRSKITWVSLLAALCVVAALGAFMWIMMNPGLAGKLGLIGQKANFSFGGQEKDWSAFLSVLVMMSGIMGMLFCSVILAYVFGREYAEGTAKNMLALPVGRGSFLAAKLCVAAAWLTALTIAMICETYFLGALLGLPGYSSALFWGAVVKIGELAIMSFCASMPIAWIAVATKGYFAPLGFTIATLFLASIFGHTGWGRWCPWSIIGLYSGAAGPGTDIGIGSWLVIAATFALGGGLTLGHLKLADNVQ